VGILGKQNQQIAKAAILVPCAGLDVVDDVDAWLSPARWVKKSRESVEELLG
jgi:hypothetical protein